MLFATAQLSPATFDFLTTGPRTDTPAGLPVAARRALARLAGDGHLGPDPRGVDRRPYHVAAHLTRGGGSESATVYTRDVSAWAVGLVGPVSFMLGAKVTLKLVLPDGRPATVTARVRRCRSIGGGWSDVHAEFCLPQYAFESA